MEIERYIMNFATEDSRMIESQAQVALREHHIDTVNCLKAGASSFACKFRIYRHSALHIECHLAEVLPVKECAYIEAFGGHIRVDKHQSS